MTPIRKKAAWVTICIVCVGGFEGLRTVAYRDTGGVPTICFGETKGTKMTDRRTPEECRTMLEGRVAEFGAGVDRCVTVPLPPARKAALTSFAYNVGISAMCKSSVVKKINMGNVKSGCDALLKYVTAAGITLPGLAKRRQAERKLCLEGT